MDPSVGYYSVSYVIVAAIALFMLSGVLSALHRNKKAQFIASTILLLIIAAASAYALSTGELSFVLDIFLIYPFSTLFLALFSVTLIMINMLAFQYSGDYPAFSLLLAFAALGMFVIATASSLIMILLGLELIALPTAFMIMINGKKYVEAAVKLFILSAISIAVFAFAVALVFPYLPQLSLTTLYYSSTYDSYLVLLAMLLFIAALSFDATLFPFNLWAPDVYTGAPGYVTAMLAGINKKVAFVALFEVLFIVMIPYSNVFSSAFQALAILTMFFGNLLALVQTNVKRLFAYSSISQAGYIALGFVSATPYGIEAAIFQIVAHSFMIIGAFAIVLWLEAKNIKTLQDYSGMGARNAVMAFSLTIFMLSMIGIPPLAGFVGKLLLFTSVINSGFIVLAIIAIINTFISVYYYAKVIFAMYSGGDKKSAQKLSGAWSVTATVAICLAVVILFGIFPQLLINAASLAGSTLYLIR